jgi:Zn-dependent protease with chaperone function
MQVHNWLAKWLTRLYARTITFSGVTEEETYQSHGEEHRVFWIDAEKWPMGGQYTPFETILLNKSTLNDVSEEVADYVFLHEVGHSKPPTIVNLGSFVVRLPLMMLAIFGLPTLILRWLIFAFSSPPTNRLIGFSLAFLFVALLILVPLILISWLDEGHAELFAVSKIGEKTYRRCLEEIRENSDGGRIRQVFRRIFYPYPSIVIRVANRLDSTSSV